MKTRQKAGQMGLFEQSKTTISTEKKASNCQKAFTTFTISAKKINTNASDYYIAGNGHKTGQSDAICRLL